MLGSALHEGGWFDTAHEAPSIEDASRSRIRTTAWCAVRTLFAEETRLTMLVGVAVGFELATGAGLRLVRDRARTQPPIRRNRSMEIRYYGHATFELADGDTSVLIDPFLTGNPKATIAAEDLSRRRSC